MATKLSIQKVLPNGTPTGPIVSVDFNPEEYSLNKDNNFASQAIPGLSSPLLQYVHGNVATLDMELLFDTWDTPDSKKIDVRTKTSIITDLLKIESETHAPPIVALSWSSLQFTGVLTKAASKFLLFDQSGTPVRARLNVTFQEYVDPERQAKKDNKQTADFTKSHQTTSGEDLWAIAAQHYGDAALWRPIAIANGLDDPSQLPGSVRLIVPSLPFRDPETSQVVS
jgi:hypothetical protein